MAHVDTIADPDIKALYRRELLDRFSAFAFPRARGRAEWQPSGAPFGPAPQPGSPQRSRRTQRLRRGRNGRARAMPCLPRYLAGLMRWPRELPGTPTRWRAEPLDPRFAALLDALDDGARLKRTNLPTILASKGMVPRTRRICIAAIRLSLPMTAPRDQRRRNWPRRSICWSSVRRSNRAGRGNGRFERSFRMSLCRTAAAVEEKAGIRCAPRQMASARRPLHPGRPLKQWRTNGRRRHLQGEKEMAAMRR
jgi:hypothetical protein